MNTMTTEELQNGRTYVSLSFSCPPELEEAIKKRMLERGFDSRSAYLRWLFERERTVDPLKHRCSPAFVSPATYAKMPAKVTSMDTLLDPLDKRVTLSIAEVSELLGYDPDTTRRHLKRKTIPGGFQAVAGGEWRIKRSVLEKWWANLGRS